MKVIGFLLIIASSVWLGVKKYYNSREYLETLNSVIHLLILIKSELETKCLSIPQISNILESKASGKASVFLKDFDSSLQHLGEFELRDIWNTSAVVALSELGERELDSFCALGGILGKYELHQQISAIDNCINELRESYCGILQSLPEQRRLWIGISSCAGAMLAIVLV